MSLHSGGISAICQATLRPLRRASSHSQPRTGIHLEGIVVKDIDASPARQGLGPVELPVSRRYGTRLSGSAHGMGRAQGVGICTATGLVQCPVVRHAIGARRRALRQDRARPIHQDWTQSPSSKPTTNRRSRAILTRVIFSSPHSPCAGRRAGDSRPAPTLCEHHSKELQSPINQQTIGAHLTHWPLLCTTLRHTEVRLLGVKARRFCVRQQSLGCGLIVDHSSAGRRTESCRRPPRTIPSVTGTR